MTTISSFFRRRSTTRQGVDFSDIVKRAVWNKARMIPGADINLWRMDACGALIYWFDYGKTQIGGFGWEIDHIQPVALGGVDQFSNLQALQWQNNRHKSDSLSQNYCVVHP